MARAIGDSDLGGPGMDLVRRFDALAELARIICPVLVCTGARDPVTPPAAAREIAAAPPRARLEVLGCAGHVPWLDRPDGFWPVVTAFAARADMLS